jgi:ATP-binding cassette, subfamily B, multidrug efflux pump
MIRATDDVEKVRLFIGQGLVAARGRGHFAVRHGDHPVLHQRRAGMDSHADPACCDRGVHYLCEPCHADVLQGAAEVIAFEYVLQENLAGIKVIKAFTREKEEHVKFKLRRGCDHEPADCGLALVYVHVPVHFPGRQPWAGGDPVCGRQADHCRRAQSWRMAGIFAVFDLPVLPHHDVRHDRHANGTGWRVRERIFEILDARSDIVDKADAIKLPDVKGNVKFEDVTFRYFGGGEPVLNKVTFEAKPGERIALLGATGSGKTTIINLLPRFYDPTEGRITIDGYDLRDVTLDSLRSQIGIVLQETTLFSGSIRENIAFGKPDATLEEIEAAAKAAAAHDFIMSFPEGYNTHVGERGATLSGGQKQRVAIARALLLNPRILILDDSTSSVDLNTEAQIQKALDVLMEGRTSFVIAQRIGTVMNADKILVLDKGEVVAQGNTPT